MEAYQAKAIRLYVNFFLKDRVTDFENRITKAKKNAIAYVQKEIESKGNNADDLFYWCNVKNSLEKI
jgi:hypothetical protein